MGLYRRSDCRLCGSTDLELVLPLTPTPPGDSYTDDQEFARNIPTYPIDLFLCKKCGYVHLRDVLPPEEIYPDYLYVTESSHGLRNHFVSYAKETIAKTGIVSGDLVVDIGSNDGTLLRCFQDSGCNVLGVDPASEIAAQATQSGIPTVSNYFSGDLGEEMAEKHGKAKLITVNNCLANLDDLDDILRGVGSLLDEDGVFVIEFAYLLDLVKGMIFDYIYHEHLSYFSLKPLCLFLRKHGLEAFDCSRSDSKGGSMRLFVKREGSTREVKTGIEETLLEEETFRIHSPETYREFEERIHHEREVCRKVMREWKKQGKKIVGYGASVTSTTLIYHFGMGDFIDFLVDDNPAKIGRYSPGLGVPVRSGAALTPESHQNTVVLAWRYVEVIAKGNPHLIGEGRNILVPLPKATVIS